MVTSERINIKKERDGITVHIRPRKNWFALIYTLLTLIALPIIALFVMRITSQDKEAGYISTLIVVGFLSLIAAFHTFALLWNLFGEENISIRNARFTRRLAVGGLGLRKSFPSDELFNLRTSGLVEDVDKEMSDRVWWPLGMAEERIAVNTSYLRDYRFGIRLENSEAIAVAHALQPYLGDTSNDSLNRTRNSAALINRDAPIAS